MLTFVLLGLALCSFAALTRWRPGVYLAILVAFLQDPLRKLTPGTPVYFNLLTGVVFAAAIAGAWNARVPLRPRAIFGWRRYLGAPVGIYLAWVAFQALHSLVSFGMLSISALGLISYLAPFVALVFAYQMFARGGPEGVTRVLWFYLALATLGMLTVYLQSIGIENPAFGEIGVGIRIYDKAGILQANSGIFRASEIAAWHASTAICISIVLATNRKTTWWGLLACAAVVAGLAAIGVLTGRRKFLVVVAIFAFAYTALVFLFDRKRRAMGVGMGVVGALAYFVGEAFVRDAFRTREQDSAQYTYYVQRMSTVFGAVPHRFVELGAAPVSWALDQFGFFGAGAGVGTQGVQHLAPILAQSIGAAEGGLGKITLELGVPGLFIVGWLAVAMIRHIFDILRRLAAVSSRLLRLGCGLVALLAANAASFSVATQAFGDMFVLLFLGLILGAVMALPALAGVAEKTPRSVARARPGGALAGNQALAGR